MVSGTIMPAADFVTPARAAKLLRVSRSLVYKWIRNGTMDSYRVQGKRTILIHKQEVLNFKGMVVVEKQRNGRNPDGA